MKNDKGKLQNIKNEHLKTTDPFKYYLSNVDNEDVMTELKWINPIVFKKIIRLNYINSIRNKEPISKCPECGKPIQYDNDTCEEYCETCGVITRTSYPYTAGIKFTIEYGVRL